MLINFVTIGFVISEITVCVLAEVLLIELIDETICDIKDFSCSPGGIAYTDMTRSHSGVERQLIF